MEREEGSPETASSLSAPRSRDGMMLQQKRVGSLAFPFTAVGVEGEEETTLFMSRTNFFSNLFFSNSPHGRICKWTPYQFVLET